jgi:PEP-CTERM motif
MKTRSFAAFALLAAAPAFAQTVTLDFEGAAGYVNGIDQFYNGGTDSVGQSGPNYGVSFTADAVALSNDALGPYYDGAPSPLTVMFAFDSNAFMNVASGFAGTLTFAYSALASSVVNIYAGLNGTGALLGSASLSGNASNGCSTTQFCHFDFTSVQFAGLARSVSFGDNPNGVLYDNVTIAPVPEPSTYLLMALGLAAVGVVKRRRAG